MNKLLVPACSVVIINFNTFHLTVSCIQSVLEQCKKEEYEIILVDNGSTECSTERFRILFPHVKLVVSDTNLGFAGGNNLGIEHARGEFILLLNSDTVMLNDVVAEGIAIMRTDESIGVVSGQLRFPDGSLQAVAGRFPSLSRELKELFRLTYFYDSDQRSKYYLGDRWDYNKAVSSDWVWGACFMFRKKDLAFFPGQKLHEHFFMYQEDIQWCYHFKKVLRKKVLYSPSPKLIHYMGGSDLASKDLEKKYFGRILPNEHRWLQMVKGRLYTFTYYILKSIYYLTLRRKRDIEKSKLFLKVAFR